MKYKFLTGLFALWLCATAFGVWSMARYSNQPGAEAAAPQNFPAREAHFSLDSTVPTLVMLAHPRCVCTRASISELSDLMSANPGRLRAYVFFYQPATESKDWLKTELWESAEQIPGVTVISDLDASVTKTFGAFTSGQTLLYDSQGQLLFKGGITAGRGHTGDNLGIAAIKTYLKKGAVSSNESSVYGCAITGEGAPVVQIQ